MADLRIVRRMARWWECLLLLGVVAFFGWVIRMGLRSTSPDVFGHVLIPPYFLLLYAMLAALINRRKLIVTPQGLVMKNGPVPLGSTVRIPRAEIAFVYHQLITALSDDGETTIPMQRLIGVVTKARRDVTIFGEFASEEEARARALKVATALGSGPQQPPIPVRPLVAPAEYPVDYRLVWIWVGLIVAAFVTGIVWEILHRQGVTT